jgi:hypothetical protein
LMKRQKDRAPVVSHLFLLFKPVLIVQNTIRENSYLLIDRYIYLLNVLPQYSLVLNSRQCLISLSLYIPHCLSEALAAGAQFLFVAQTSTVHCLINAISSSPVGLFRPLLFVNKETCNLNSLCAGRKDLRNIKTLIEFVRSAGVGSLYCTNISV